MTPPRKPGRPRKPDKAVTFSGSMHPSQLAKMRALQQGQPLGKFLVRRLGLENAELRRDAAPPMNPNNPELHED